MTNDNPIMRRVVQIISWLAFLGTIVPSVAFLAGYLSLDQCKWQMLLATIVWFVATPLWMGRETKAADPQAVDPL
jgi:hypothetical protein